MQRTINKIPNPKWRKYLPRTVLSWHWYVRLLGSCFSVLKNVSGWSGATSYCHWIKARGRGTTPLPTALPSSLCLQPQPSTHCVPRKIKKIHIYTGLSFTLLHILLSTRKRTKEGRAHFHEDAASTCWPQGEFPNTAMILLIQLQCQVMLKRWLNLHVIPRLENLTNYNSHVQVRLRPLLGLHLKSILWRGKVRKKIHGRPSGVFKCIRNRGRIQSYYNLCFSFHSPTLKVQTIMLYLEHKQPNIFNDLTNKEETLRKN